MYHGDGSYKTEYEMEDSLINLLEAEREMANKYNIAISAYQLAKRNRLKTMEYIKDIEKTKEMLEEARANVKRHCSEKLGIKTNIVDLLYESN